MKPLREKKTKQVERKGKEDGKGHRKGSNWKKIRKGVALWVNPGVGQKKKKGKGRFTGGGKGSGKQRSVKAGRRQKSHEKRG